MTERNSEQEIELERLASIVESSDDAIISKSLDGIIRSWNSGATKIFGYEPAEIIGQPVLKLIPPDLHHEEDEILAKLRRGERIEHFDTVRLTKDGRRVDISLTVSPLRDRAGNITGASKVARDVSERKRAEALQKLLMDELNHRVKNTLAVVQSIASQSLALTKSPDAFVETFSGRLQALSRAHDLLVRERMQGIRLRDLIESQLLAEGEGRANVKMTGPAVIIRGTLVTHLSLIMHELAANAQRNGALAQSSPDVSIEWALKPGGTNTIELVWRERASRAGSFPAATDFGAHLIEKALKASGGSARIEPDEDGFSAVIEFDIQDSGDIADQSPAAEAPPASPPAVPVTSFEGLKALIVEDEAIVAMDLEMKFEQHGFEIVGTASSVAEALDIIANASPDIALLDANLHGERVGPVAEALSASAIPFAFASGYGREALPEGYEDAELLSKPFGDARLLNVLSRLAGRALAQKTA